MVRNICKRVDIDWIAIPTATKIHVIFRIFHSLPVATAFPIVYVIVVFYLAESRMAETKRNIVTILVMGFSWLTLLTHAFGMIHINSEQGLSMRRALVLFSNFVQREQDIVLATVLFLCLQSISFLPVAYIHSTMVVNYAYATSLRIVRKRHKLMHTLHASGWLKISYRLLNLFKQASIFCCLLPELMFRRFRPKRWLRLKRVQKAKAKVRVFLPATKMADALNEKGSTAVAHQWNVMGAVRERVVLR